MFSPQATRKHAFVLLEALLAVAIFSLGVITLGKCVSNCLTVERICNEDDIVRRVLQNRMAEIESGAISLKSLSTESLPGPLEAMTLTCSGAPLDSNNENGQAITGLSLVTLDLGWTSSGERHTRSLAFYLYDRKP